MRPAGRRHRPSMPPHPTPEKCWRGRFGGRQPPPGRSVGSQLEFPTFWWLLFPRYDTGPTFARVDPNVGSRPITVVAHYVQPDWMSRLSEREATLHPRARLDLELDCVWDSAQPRQLAESAARQAPTERTVPVDAVTLAALD